MTKTCNSCARALISTARAALLFGVVIVFSHPARAQISLGLDAGANADPICLNGTSVAVHPSGSNCTAAGVAPPYLRIGSSPNFVQFDVVTGTATFNTAANFNANVSMTGSLDVSAVTNFTDTVSFSGSSTIFATPTTFTFGSTFQASSTFNNVATFNGLADFNGSVTSNSIMNSGTVSTNILSSVLTQSDRIEVTDSIYVSPGANITMGDNIVHGVAAGIVGTDAVNVAQLNAATSGITADVTALETVTATHTSQIAAIETVNTTQSSQITAIQAVNTTQSSQISALEAARDLVSGRVDTLFDLRSADRRDMKQGIASAIAIAPAPMPSAPGKVSYAVNGATFRGEYAIGGSLMYRLPGDTPVAVNVGFSYAGRKNNGARVGVAGEF